MAISTAQIWTKVYFGLLLFAAILIPRQVTFGQSFGVELGNTLMPASGGMGGTSISQPQDLISAINANPATLRQFRGTQFTFGGGMVGPTYNISNDGTVLPNIGNYSAKSQSPASILGNIGVVQEMTALGKPITVGAGFISTAGAGLDVSGVPASNGTASTFTALHLMPSVGMDVTDRLTIGAGFGIGISTLDGIFTGISRNAVDYSVRGTAGMNFRLNECQSIGAYWHSKEGFTFDDAIRLQLPGGGFSASQDISLDLPASVGIGWADRSFMNGRMLVATDFVYRFYEDTDLFGELYDNQLSIQVGTQIDMGRMKVRFGYVWADNLLKDIPAASAGGVVPPGAVDAIQYVQAQFAAIAEHRFTMGFGIPNLLPGVDLDIFGGGMFEADQQFGASYASIESYFLGGAMTWRFGRGSGCQLAPNSWCQPNQQYATY